MYCTNKATLLERHYNLIFSCWFESLYFLLLGLIYPGTSVLRTNLFGLLMHHPATITEGPEHRFDKVPWEYPSEGSCVPCVGHSSNWVLGLESGCAGKAWVPSGLPSPGLGPCTGCTEWHQDTRSTYVRHFHHEHLC